MKNKLYTLLSLSCLIVFTACSDFLKEESQSEVIPKTTTDFSELLLGTGYPSLEKPNFSFTSLMDDDVAMNLTFIGNEPDYYVESSDAVTYFPTYSWQPTFGDFDGMGNDIAQTPGSTAYAGFYERILGCNAVLDNIDNAIGTQAERDRIKAEALALRAMYYFWLVNLYGEPYNHDKEALGVPLKLDSGLTEEAIARSTVGYIYEEVIVKGLVEAASLMDPLTIVRKDFHINQPAIHILLSRVYLYMGKYDECIQQVNSAIEQGAVVLDMVNALPTILATGSTTLYTPVGYGNPEVEWLFGRTPAMDLSAYRLGTSPEFQVLWDKTNDKRYQADNFMPDTKNEVLMQKPRGTAQLGQSIRTAEAYLNRAEAYALSGNTAGALSDLNYLRHRRIAGYVDVTALSGQALVDEIRLERRKELCYEGHRWFDLRRYGMPKIEHTYKYEKGGATYVFTLEKGDPMYTLPFPAILIDKNKNLLQNPSGSMGNREGATL